MARVHPVELIRPIAAIAIGGSILIALLTGVLRDRDRAGLAALAITVGFLLRPGAPAALIVGLGLFIAAVTLLSRDQRPRYGPVITRALSSIGLALVVVAAVIAIQQGGLREWTEDLATPDSCTPAVGAPNVYMVLLDGYPGDEAATLEPTFDPDAFPMRLNELGFDVQRHSRSDYFSTAETLGSMFSMAPLQGDPTPEQLRQMINQGEALRVLRDQGYEVRTITSGFSHIDLSSATRVERMVGPTEFEFVLLRYTVLGAAIEAIAPDAFSSLHRGRIEQSFDRLADLASQPVEHPTFTFAHVPAPHGPWVFGASGEPVIQPLTRFYTDLPVDYGVTRTAALRMSFGEATHIAHLTTMALARVIAADPTAVIVVFSDHGPGTAWRSDAPDSSDLRERGSNFLAVRSPGQHGLFPDGTTPRTIFGRLFAEYVGTSGHVRGSCSGDDAGG